jgi:cytochrome P450
VISAPATMVKAVPPNPLPRLRQMAAIRQFHSGFEVLRDAGGPVTRLSLGPRGLIPPIVLTTSPQGAHDVLSRTGNGTDRTRIHEEMRNLLGPNLFDLEDMPWKPRRRFLQPVFTKQHVQNYAGDMAQAAEGISAGWRQGALVNIDAECRRITLRALGRSVLGVDLDEHAESIAGPLQTALKYLSDRAVAPVRAPRWLPTPARHRARAAGATLERFAGDVLQACRADPAKPAPLVRALINATDPETGQRLTDADIRDELIIFLLAGHDTTSTLLSYTLWTLGHRIELQEKVRAEVMAIGDRELTPEDVPRLGFTVQVLHEALRLCPPGSGVMRVATQDIDVDGYRVEGGTLLVVGICAIQRDPALWDRPLTFDPERFAPGRMKSIDRWQYLPFGGGPRSCIGDHFAMLEAALAVATLIRRHDFRSCSATFPLTSPFTTVADGPINVRVTPRCSANQ